MKEEELLKRILEKPEIELVKAKFGELNIDGQSFLIKNIENLERM